MASALIPFIDLRGKTPLDLLRAYPDRARDMLKAARGTWGVWSRVASLAALPVGDRVSQRWLKKQGNPYLYEIESFGEMLSTSGVVALNVAFEWGCTSGVWNYGESAAMLRVLDWPFPGLGKYTVVALQDGKAGTFYNVTWPGVSGVFTAMAPGRFSAAVNQAPSRRHHLGFIGDWAKNRWLLSGQQALPPAHVLRQVCERAANYEEAKDALIKTPIAIPAIFILGGVQPGEGCVIERTEQRAEVFELGVHSHVTAANQFASALGNEGLGWRPREIDSAGRYRQSLAIQPHELEAADFGWLAAPILNANTRLAVVSDAATSRLLVQGFEGAMPVTSLFQLPAAAPKQRLAV